MKTYFLGAEEVRAYLLDLLERLDPMPTVWCPVTESGASLVTELARLAQSHRPDLLSKVELEPIVAGKDGVALLGKSSLEGRGVLVLDGAIHSGRMMSACVEELLKQAPASVITYALVVKRRSVFFPTLWGVMTDDTDRTYFQLEKIPNNRLDAGQASQPAVHLRRLTASHTVPITSGVPSIDRVTWGDRLFQMQTHPGTCTYVLEQADVALGFVTVHHEPDSLSVGEVVVAEAARGKKYGGILIRFADTLARQTDCKKVRLNAIKDRVPTYTRFGYRKADGGIIRLEQEEYQPMEKAVLYHQLDLIHPFEMGDAADPDRGAAPSVVQPDGS